ncbi:endo-1,4-beta-xylanase [Thermoflexibacter ruber]|uniref:Beta-xylanase n=2 Tax=Thermoflexibacter ruber TaxID=1003 RepID=A0A1I2G8I2_9BACT|nr:endo-1,4-beta-xylanase [Thermoflexibacter ruber]
MNESFKNCFNLSTPKTKLMKMNKLIIFLSTIFAIMLLSVSCKKNIDTVQNPKPDNSTPFVPEQTLKEKAPFPIGASIDPTHLKTNLRYKNVLIKEFNSITPENMMKMNMIQPAPNRFDYTKADELVNFAIQDKKRIHGHALIWHESLPTWVQNFQGDSLAWENLFKTHIQTVVGYYKGKLAGWDVVNEAIGNDGGTRNDNTNQGSIWRRKLGADYVARAFLYARQADPDVLLFYNDYGQESNPKKLQAIISLVQDLKRRNIPIDGLGLQMHIDINTSEAGINYAIQESVKTGLKIHISEIDIALNPSNSTLEKPTAEMLERQRQKYLMVVRAYKNLVPKAQQYGITQWNVGDADSWIRSYLKRNDFPLIFDVNYDRKPSYYGVLEGFK